MAEQGTVKWYNNAKGYGFIRRERGGRDVLIRIADLEASGLLTLREGDKVRFDVVEGRNGPEAKKVVILAA